MSIVSDDFKRPFTKPSGKRGYRDRFRQRGPLMKGGFDPVNQMKRMEGLATEDGLTMDARKLGEDHLGGHFRTAATAIAKEYKKKKKK